MSDTVQYISEDTPEQGTLREVAPGVHWLRMPLPFQLDHINLWVLEDEDGWTLVDTGFCNDKVKALWERLFETKLAGRPVRRIVVTHFHPDHMGLAGWISERFPVPLWATLGEWAMGRMLSLDSGESSRALFREFYHRAGFGEDLLEIVDERLNPYPKRVYAIPGAFHRLTDGATFTVDGREWRVIVGTGHSPEHGCLYCPSLKVLISGDQILPRITPNVSVWPQEPDADPLALFLASLDRFRPLPADTLVLSSHDRPFTGLPARLDQLAHHHDSRLDEIVEACDEPRTAMDILKRLFSRKLDQHQLFFAIGESLAHLHYLMGTGRIERTTDPAGVYRYSRR